MCSVSERIHDGSEVIWYLRTQFDHITFGNRHILRETPVFTHDTDRDGVLAYMPHSSTTVTAMSADDVSFGRNAFADRKIADTGSNIFHHSDELMPHRIRRFAMCL